MTFTTENVYTNYTLVSHSPTHRKSLSEVVAEGMLGNTKRLSCEFLYDQVGSQLFEKITELEEYYLTRAEYSILKKRALELADLFTGKDPLVIELGSGSSSKTKAILEAFIQSHGHVSYIPIDISKSILDESAKQLIKLYKDKITVYGHHGTYHQALSYIQHHYANKTKLILFLGSSIGNFDRNDAAKFLETLRKEMRENDRMLVGIDRRKNKAVLEAAYDDSLGVTAQFNLNLLDRINKELDANFDVKNFEHVADYNESDGYVRMYLRSKVPQKVKLGKLNKEISFGDSEMIHTENSVKYNDLELNILADTSSLEILELWRDDEEKFSLLLLGPQESKSADEIVKHYQANLESAWKFSDRIFSFISEDAFYERPIQLRHPFIFYLGHLPAFANNQICNYALQRKDTTVNSYFDTIFERGIDPDVTTGTCHDHSVVPPSWPTRNEVLEYRDKVRLRVNACLSELLKSNNVMAIKGRAAIMSAEHDLMHAETLLYMYQNLDTSKKLKPSVEELNYKFGKVNKVVQDMVTIPAGTISLGADFHEIDFGWDNEFPKTKVNVAEFNMDRHPVTNAQFLKFVEQGGYQNRSFWNDKTWKWREENNITHPHFWVFNKADNSYYVKTLFGDKFPIQQVGDWPVFCSNAEASAYCKFIGKRLPTEAEWQRAAYGGKNRGDDVTVEKKFPWGNEEPKAGVHGNFNFFSFAPMPIGSFPKGRSEFGVEDLMGDAWEHTSTVFNGLPGFIAYIPSYMQYSQDFFDGQHYVVKGGSFATAPQLLRKSFRNWYQDVYPFMFAKFRCCV